MTTNTPDLDVAGTVAELHTGQGYVVLPGLLPLDLATIIRTQILACADADKAHDKLILQNGRWRVRLVGRGDIFMELAVHSAITRIAEAMLGAGFVMGGLSAHTITAGAPPQGVHVDYPYSVMSEPFPDPPMQLQTIWALDAFTEENGATRVLPHSQKTRRRPDRQEFYDKSIPVLCPAGSLILSHGGLWHDSATNRSQTDRVAILGNYTPFWVKSVEGFPDTIKSPDFQPTPAQRKLLGYDTRDAMMKAVAWKREDKNAPKPPY
jgi:ectoine hydroxylase-related dioxygenase (phytanoyl-CoA dioxygenase family)